MESGNEIMHEYMYQKINESSDSEEDDKIKHISSPKKDK